MQIEQNNNTIICGRVAKEPIIKNISKNGETFLLIDLSVVVGEMPSGSAIWANVNIWGKLAEKNRHIKKGDYVTILGIIEKREFEGETRKNIKAQMVFIDSPLRKIVEQSITDENFETLKPLDSDEDSPF